MEIPHVVKLGGFHMEGFLLIFTEAKLLIKTVTTRPQLFASLLFSGQHQHDIHGPEAFSVWQFQLGQDFVVNLLSNRLVQVLEAVCLLRDVEPNFMPWSLYSKYCLAWVPAVGCRV